MPLFSLGLMKKLPIKRQYIEAGMSVSPAKDAAIVGTFGQYFVNISPLFRPGLVLGAMGHKEKNWKVALYYGVAIQVGIFTGIVTGDGFGGGFNLSLGR